VRRPAAIAAIVLVVLACLGIGAAWAYDRGQEDTIAKGVTVGGVDVGGLTPDEARAKLRRSLLDPLRQPIVVERGTRAWRLSAREARISADVEASVRSALDRSREGSFLTRTARLVTGGEVDENLEPEMTYSRKAVVRLLDRVRADVDREPKDASLDFAADGVSQVASQPGMKLKASKLHRRIRAAILDPAADRTFKAEMVKVQPKVTTAELAEKYPKVVLVNRGGYKLTLLEDLKPVKTYNIAVGKVGLETPAGLYTIQDKQVNPSWHVPNSDWAGDLAGKVIPPGPDNPIKARWMGIYNGAGIHGTSDVGSLGSAASHGCVRMAIPDVEDLYDRVDVGTPVYIS
jgi:lipoprotein-anchoring transpeptidase ErfK/SrfK